MGKYFGNKEFYVKSAKLAVPSMLQQLLTSTMGIVDTMMVSWIGAVSAVGIGSQLEMMGFTVAFGVMEGTGIFASQFFGAKDEAGLKKTFGLSLLLNAGIGILWCLAISLFGREIVSFYMKDEVIIEQALQYLNIARFAYPLTFTAFTFNYLYRCIHQTTVPMKISILAMASNGILNYLLIFGAFGFPKLGIAGAALGTLIAQMISLSTYMIYSFVKKAPFLGNFEEMFHLSSSFVKPVMNRTYPMIINETFFSFGSSMFIKAYSMLGTRITDAYYVGNTITNLFFTICNGMSVACGMILGADLGKGDIEQAVKESNWFITLSLVFSVLVTIIIVSTAGGMTTLFGLTDPETERIAQGVVRVASVRISFRLIVVVIFAALRAGGDAKFLMFLDSGVMWLVGIPLVYFFIVTLGMTNFTLIFLLVQLEQVVRIVIGYQRFHSQKWAINLTNIA